MMIRQLDAPDARAASTNSFSFSDSTWPRTTRAMYIQPRTPSTRMIVCRAVTEVLERDREQRQLRARRGTGRWCAQQPVDRRCRRSRRPRRRSRPTKVENDRDREADRQRDLAGVQQLAELVAAELVGAEPVLRPTGRAPRRRVRCRSSWRVRREPRWRRSRRCTGSPGRRARPTASRWRKKRRQKSCHCVRATGLGADRQLAARAIGGAATRRHDSRIRGSSTP